MPSPIGLSQAPIGKNLTHSTTEAETISRARQAIDELNLALDHAQAKLEDMKAFQSYITGEVEVTYKRYHEVLQRLNGTVAEVPAKNRY